MRTGQLGLRDLAKTETHSSLYWSLLRLIKLFFYEIVWDSNIFNPRFKFH